jgi:hypothetical protein
MRWLLQPVVKYESRTDVDRSGLLPNEAYADRQHDFAMDASDIDGPDIDASVLFGAQPNSLGMPL